MALIQIRDVPEETYETIRRRARARGQSIQTYMLERTIEVASRPDQRELNERAAARAELYPQIDREVIVSILDEVRDR
jgi:uncharacterized protein (DUF1778 family)